MSVHTTTDDDASLLADIRATLMPGFEGVDAPAWVLDALRHGLVSVCVYGDNVRSADQLRTLGHALRTARPDALVAIDEEGGEVTRLHYADGSPYPGAAVLGRIDDPAYTAAIGARVAEDVRRVGASLVLAPDADVNANPRNPVIGTRSFSADPAHAAVHVAAWVRGAQAAGVAACPKHFPGHGDTTADSHLTLPVVGVAPEVLEARELVPFRGAIAADAQTIMTSHILLPRIDPDAPATFSNRILQGILRNRLGFTGVIVSDALDMAGASGEIGIPAAAVRALVAGCDLLCIGPNTTPEVFAEIEARIRSAVEAGELSAERVHDAAARVRQLAVDVPAIVPEELTGPFVPTADDATIAAELPDIAASFSGLPQATRWLGSHPDADIVRIETEANTAIGVAPWGPFAAVSAPLPGTDVPVAAFSSRTTHRATADTLSAWASWGDPERGVIVIGRELRHHAFALAGIETLRDRGVPVLTIDMGWPDADHPADLETAGASRLVGAALLTVLAEPSSAE